MNRIGSHSGSFHADDALGVAMLKALHPRAEIVRTRDAAVWGTCDALVDVGGEHDPTRNRFDHHQKGFSARRANGSPFAGSGLVWAAYGVQYVQSKVAGLTRLEAELLAQAVDERLIQPADAIDVGIDIPGPKDFNLAGIIDAMNITWDEGPVDEDARFAEAVHLADAVLGNFVRALAAEHKSAQLVRAAPTLLDNRVLVLDAPRIPFDRVVCEEMPDVHFVVYPESTGRQWQVRVVPSVLGRFEARADLPQEWAGLRDEALAEATGVPDAVFCHTGRFICGAGSKAGALSLAQEAVAAMARKP